MEPTSLAAVTSALTFLGTECSKGMASEAGKSLWKRVIALFGWTKEPSIDRLNSSIDSKLQSDVELLKQLAKLLQESDYNSDPSSQKFGSLVNNIVAQKVVVAKNINNITL